MLGIGEIFEAQCLRGRNHVLERIAAIRRLGVAMQIAPQIRIRDQFRQTTASRGLDLSMVFAQLRRNERQSDGAIDRFLGISCDPLGSLEDSVLADLEPALLREAAQRNVVRFRSGKVDKRCTQNVRSHDAQIDLQAAAQTHACASSSLRYHFGDIGMADEAFGRASGPACADEDVEVAHRLPHPTIASRDDHPLDTGYALQIAHQSVGILRGHRELHSVFFRKMRRDGVLDVPLGLLPEPGQRANAPVTRRAQHLLGGLHVEVVP